MKMKKRKNLIRAALTAVFAALISAGAFAAVPLGNIPIVLQNMFALLSGLVLGPVLGGSAVLLFLLAGAVGAPVFAGGKAGFTHFLGPTGGFLYGYFLAAALAGCIAGAPRPEKKTPLWLIITAAVLGMAVVYIPGIFQLKTIYKMTLGKALLVGCLPYLPGDAVKTVVAVLAAPRLRILIADILGENRKKSE
jgi:biotin transport system substrate-specific component